MPSQRLTVRPWASFSTKVSSRVFLIQLRDLVDGVVPGDVFPMVGAGPADLRLHQAARVEDVLLERGALGAERAAIDGVVRIAFDVDHLRGDVLGLVAQRVDDDAAAHRAVGAGGAGLGGARDLQLAQLRIGGRQVEAENGGGRAADGRDFQEVPAISLHDAILPQRRFQVEQTQERDCNRSGKPRVGEHHEAGRLRRGFQSDLKPLCSAQARATWAPL